jgi:trigger factor
VASEYSKVVNDYAKHARIPGFRPGKAPAATAERRFAKEILEETRERLVPRAYHEAIEQEKLKPVAVIDVSDISIEKQLPLTFRVTVDVDPDFTLPEYKGIALPAQPVKVGPEDVEQLIANLQERQAKFDDNPGRTAARGDIVVIDYLGLCEGKPVGELAPERAELSQGKDFWVLLLEGHEFLPGIVKALEGVKVGETRELKVAWPADFAVATLAGREAVYTLKVSMVRERKLPELNDEFAKAVGTESLDDLQAKVRENLVAQAEAGERGRQKDELLKWLLEQTPLADLPQSVVEEQARHIIRDVVADNVRRGLSKDQIEEHRDDIFNRAAQSSADRVKVEYILTRIADLEKVTVEEADVAQRIGEMAQRYGMPPQKLRADLEKREALDALRRSLRLDKTLDLLHGLASIQPA